MKKLIDDKKKSGEWKIQLILKINFISSISFNGTRDMHSKSDNYEIMIGDDTNEIIKDLFKSILKRYQGELQVSMRGSEFAFGHVEFMNYIFHKIDLKRSGSYIETPHWIKIKKATLNGHNKKDNKCFQYAVTNVLNYDEIKENHHRVKKVKPFIDKYNWTDINFPSHANDWKKFELNNKSIALNVLYVPKIEYTIRHVYKSKYNLTRENQVILLMITDGEKWHYLTVSRLSALLKGITSKHGGDFCCLNCFHSYPSKKVLEKHLNACEEGALLKYTHGTKFMKAPYVNYGDIECLIRKIDTCSNDPSKSSTEKINKHKMCGYSMFTSCLFDEKNNKLDYYRGKDCLKRFCQDLQKHARSIIDFEKKDMIESTPEQQYRHDREKYCFICRKPFSKDKDEDNNNDKGRNNDKVRDHCHYTGKYRGTAHRISNVLYNTPSEIPVLFHNGSNYDYDFIIKALAEEFEGDFECLGEIKEKYITFSVPIKKKKKKKNLMKIKL